MSAAAIAGHHGNIEQHKADGLDQRRVPFQAYAAQDFFVVGPVLKPSAPSVLYLATPRELADDSQQFGIIVDVVES